MVWPQSNNAELGTTLPHFCFFFKQKTAYEIPKRDWSSDVCSSDLYRFTKPHRLTGRRRQERVVAHDDPSTDDRGEGPAGRLHAVDRRPAAFGRHPGILDAPLSLEIDEGEVGVVAQRDAALAGDAEDALSAGAGEIDKTLKRQAAGVDVIEQDSDQRLHARHAGRADAG